MKKTLLFLVFIGFAFSLLAQEVACEPDPIFRDSAQVVFPLPLDPETGVGGIEMFPVCIGEPYELVFSFRIGDSAVFNGVPINLLRAEIDTTGAVEGLPEGLNYACNPPDCIFQDTTLGCIVINGIATENNPIGINNLVITATVVIDLFGPITETIPGNFFAGEYNLIVQEAGQCGTVSVNDFLAENIALSNIPNPVIDQTTIEVTSNLNGEFQFGVFDLTGKQVHNEQIQLINGYNSFIYDAADLSAGMYIYTISDGRGAISQKLVVGRR